MKVSKDKLGLDSTEKTDIINVKWEPEQIGSLRMVKGVFAGYHMNKGNWISVLLDGSADENMLFDFWRFCPHFSIGGLARNGCEDAGMPVKVQNGWCKQIWQKGFMKKSGSGKIRTIFSQFPVNGFSLNRRGCLYDLSGM